MINHKMADAMIDLDISKHHKKNLDLNSLNNSQIKKYLNTLRPGLGDDDNKLKSYMEIGDENALFVLHVKSLEPYKNVMLYDDNMEEKLREEQDQTLLLKEVDDIEIRSMGDILKIISSSLSDYKKVALYLHSTTDSPQDKPFGTLALLEFKR